MNTILEEISRYWDSVIVPLSGGLAVKLILALVIALVVRIGARMASSWLQRALVRTHANGNARVLLDRVLQFGFLLLGATWVLSIFGVQPTALVAFFGVAGLAVSLAMQDVLKNLVAGLYILVERPFTIGEHIEFRTFSGVVETIQLRTTALRTVAGQRVVIPNAMLFAEALVNRSAYGRQLVRVRVAIPLTPPVKPAAPAVPAVSPAPGVPATPETPGVPATPETPGVPVPPAREAPPGEAPPRGAAVTPSLAPASAPARSASADSRPIGETAATSMDDPDQGDDDVPERRLLDRLEQAVGAARDEGVEARPTIHMESVNADKLTVRIEMWATDARAAAPHVAWAARAALPRAEITVLE